MDNEKQEAWRETALYINVLGRLTPLELMNDYNFISNRIRTTGNRDTKSWILRELNPFIVELFWKYRPVGELAYIDFAPFILSLMDDYWTVGIDKSRNLEIDQLTRDKFNFLYADTIISKWD